MKVAPFAALAVALVIAPSAAEAYERQWHAGGSAGYAYIFGNDTGFHGLGGALHLTYGATDAFNLLAQIDVTVHPAGKLVVPSISFGPAYVVDILSVVPYIGATIGVADLWSTDPTCGQPGFACHTAKLALAVPVGLDYQVNRSIAVGFAGKYELLLVKDSPINLISAFARVEFMWGY